MSSNELKFISWVVFLGTLSTTCCVIGGLPLLIFEYIPTSCTVTVPYNATVTVKECEKEAGCTPYSTTSACLDAREKCLIKLLCTGELQSIYRQSWNVNEVFLLIAIIFSIVYMIAVTTVSATSRASKR